MLGRRRKPPAVADLAAFEAIDQAAAALAADGIRPTGAGAVCVKPADRRFPDLDPLVDQIVSVGQYDASTDEYGHRWLTRRTDPGSLEQLVSDLASVNRALAGAGVGAALLCTMVGFTSGAGHSVLVYRPRRGTWYPFVPAGDHLRDNDRELALRDRLADVLPIEGDLTKWSPLWDSPVL